MVRGDYPAAYRSESAMGCARASEKGGCSVTELFFPPASRQQMRDYERLRAVLLHFESLLVILPRLHIAFRLVV